MMNIHSILICGNFVIYGIPFLLTMHALDGVSDGFQIKRGAADRVGGVVEIFATTVEVEFPS